MGFPNSDSGSQSLLTGLPLDRDFSWNASPMSSSQLPSVAGQNSLFQCPDLHPLDCDSGQSKLPDSNLNKISLGTDQRRQLSNNNNASVMHRSQSEVESESGLLYDAGDTAKNSTW